MLMRFGYEETSPEQHACAREAVDSTAGQYSVTFLTARILLAQKADATAFVWTLTGIKVSPPPPPGRGRVLYKKDGDARRKILKRSLKRYQDPVLKARLEIFPTH